MTRPPVDPRVDEHLRRKGIGRDLEYDAQGQLDMEATLRAHGGRFMVQGSDFDLAAITFPELEHYGFDHAQKTVLLAETIATKFLGVTNPNELDALKLAALFHDVGRRWPWQRREGDPGHNIRSANIALEYFNLKNSPTSLIERATKLIAQHDLNGETPRDPLAIALWDADSLEAARLAPGTSTGADIIKKRTERMVTEWARSKETRRTWMRSRGWSS